MAWISVGGGKMKLDIYMTAISFTVRMNANISVKVGMTGKHSLHYYDDCSTANISMSVNMTAKILVMVKKLQTFQCLLKKTANFSVTVWMTVYISFTVR